MLFPRKSCFTRKAAGTERQEQAVPLPLCCLQRRTCATTLINRLLREEIPSTNGLRKGESFVPELDFVMEKDGKLIGQNMFMRAIILAVIAIVCTAISKKTFRWE